MWHGGHWNDGCLSYRQMVSSDDTPAATESGEPPAGPVTTRLRLLEGLLSSTPTTTPPTPCSTAPRSVVIYERLITVIGVLGVLTALILAGRSIIKAPAAIGWVGWTLLGLGLGLLLVGTALAAGAGRWDALVMRWRGLPTSTVGSRDRITTLIAAILLIVAATAELACFQALIDSREATVPATMTGTTP
jgi:hypothetical protein